MHLTIKERVELVLSVIIIWCRWRLLLLSELFYMLWCVIYGPKRLLLLSELFYMLWCVIYGPPCITQHFTSITLLLQITTIFHEEY